MRGRVRPPLHLAEQLRGRAELPGVLHVDLQLLPVQRMLHSIKHSRARNFVRKPFVEL